MEAAEIPFPPGLQMRRRFDDLMPQAGANDADAATGFEVFQDIAEIEIVGAEILIGIETDDRIETLMRQRQGVRFGMDRRHEMSDSGRVDAFAVFLRLDPEIGGGDLDAEFLGEEDRR